MGREHARPIGRPPASSEPQERDFSVTDDLVANAIEAAGSHTRGRDQTPTRLQ
jgi:hypothetical protein